MPFWEADSLLVSQAALSLQLQLVLEETAKSPLPPVVGILRVVGLTVRVISAADWETVWVRVRLPAVMVMVAVRVWVEVLGATE